MKDELPENAEVVDNRMQEHPQEGDATEEISKEREAQPPAQIAPGLMIEQSGGAVWTVAGVDGNRVTLSRRRKTVVRHLSALGDDIASGRLSLAAAPESVLRRSLIQIYDEGIKDPLSTAVTDFAKVTDPQAQEIRDLTGIEVAGFTHSLRATRVRKILRSHGQPQEELRGQRPVTREDILRIPEVIKNGTISSLQEHPHSKRPEKAVQFRLRDNGDVIVVKETQKRGRRMDVVSMWIEKGGRGNSSTPSVPPDSGAPAHTSAPDSAPFRASPTP